MDYQKVAENAATEYLKLMKAGFIESAVSRTSFMAGFAACLEVLNSKEPETEDKRNPIIYRITTGMGKVSTYNGHPLTFLDSTECEELDSIGYSGAKLDGTRICRQDYLNSLGKGNFTVSQTKHDDGDFSEAFTIARS